MRKCCIVIFLLWLSQFEVLAQHFQQYSVAQLPVLLEFGQPAMINPGPVAVADDGKIAVFDYNNFELFLFNSDLYQVGKFGGRGEGPGRFVAPSQFSFSKGVLFIADQPQQQINVFDINSGSYTGAIALPELYKTMGVTYVDRERVLMGTNGQHNALAGIFPVGKEDPEKVFGTPKAPYDPKFNIRSAKVSLAQGAVPNALKNLTEVHTYENGYIVAAVVFGEVQAYTLSGELRWTSYIPSVIQSQLKAINQTKNRRNDRAYALFEPRMSQELASDEQTLFAFSTGHERGTSVHISGYNLRTGKQTHQFEILPIQGSLISHFAYDAARQRFILVDSGRAMLLEAPLNPAMLKKE